MDFSSWIGQLLLQYGGLVGIGALIAAIVLALKVLANLPDDQAGNASLILNLVAFGVFVVVVGVIKIPFPPGLDELAGRLATIILAVIGLFVQLRATPIAYNLVNRARRLPAAYRVRAPIIASYSNLFR
jgi:hypothetical protein